MHIPTDAGLKLHKAEEERSVDEREYRRNIGCLCYLIHTRPDLVYSVGVLSKYMHAPKELHKAALKQVLDIYKELGVLTRVQTKLRISWIRRQ